MIRIGSDLNPPKSLGRPVVTIGMFDGVHRGHQRVLLELRRWAARLRTTTVVVTFDRSPKTLISGKPVPCITSLEHRLVLFERLGIDACAVLRFDRRLRRVSARDFVRNILCGRLRAMAVLLGFNCRFGRGAEGDYALLRQLEREGVCLARQVPRPVTVGGRPISSSAIRTAIEAGRLDDAARMLGRPVSVLGTVVRGERRGSRIGFPTANLNLHHEVKPSSGIYVCAARVGRTWRPALTSIGRKPTFPHPPAENVVEVFIPGLRRCLYGRDVEVRFVRKLRDQAKFPSVDALVRQIQNDVRALKQAHVSVDP